MERPGATAEEKRVNLLGYREEEIAPAARQRMSTDRPRLSTVVPAFNESATIQTLIDRLRAARSALSYEIIIVDDGSTDGTRAW